VTSRMGTGNSLTFFYSVECMASITRFCPDAYETRTFKIKINATKFSLPVEFDLIINVDFNLVLMSITFVCDVLPPPEVVSWSYLLVFDKDPFKGWSPVMFMQRGKHNFISMHAETSCNVSHFFVLVINSLQM
jgi:hypothetical protein